VPPLKATTALVAGLLLTAPGGALALDPPKPRPERESLETVYDRLQETAERAQTLEARERALADKLNAIRVETVEIARRMQRLESRLVELDAEIVDAQANRDRLARALGRDDEALASLIVTLQRLRRNAPEMHALAVENPLSAARAEMIVEGALPGVLAHAARLRTDLAEINRLDAELTASREDQRRALAKLNGEADRLAKLRADRSEALGRTQAEKRAAEAVIARLSSDAETLSDLVAAIEAEEARQKAAREEAERAAAARRAAENAVSPPPRRPETATLSGENPPGTIAGRSPPPEIPIPEVPAPEIPAGEAKGLFTSPAPGRVIKAYGEDSGSLQTRKGIEIASRANATIVAPYDGVVAFAGPFRGYGRLLIIDHGDGYHSLMAGLGRLDAAVGQAVLAGEPVGIMGQSDASLYYELRHEGDPIDPSVWLLPTNEARKR